MACGRWKIMEGEMVISSLKVVIFGGVCELRACRENENGVGF